MAIPDHDGNIVTGRRDGDLTTIGIVVAVLITFLVLLFVMVRADAPTSSTTNATKAPVTTTTPSAPTTPK